VPLDSTKDPLDLLVVIPAGGALQSLRLDPLNTCVVVRLLHVSVRGASGQIAELTGLGRAGCAVSEDLRFYFESDDPQILFDLPALWVDVAVEARVHLTIDAVGDDARKLVADRHHLDIQNSLRLQLSNAQRQLVQIRNASRKQTLPEGSVAQANEPLVRRNGELQEALVLAGQRVARLEADGVQVVQAMADERIQREQHFSDVVRAKDREVQDLQRTWSDRFVDIEAASSMERERLNARLQALELAVAAAQAEAQRNLRDLEASRHLLEHAAEGHARAMAEQDARDLQVRLEMEVAHAAAIARLNESVRLTNQQMIDLVGDWRQKERTFTWEVALFKRSVASAEARLHDELVAEQVSLVGMNNVMADLRGLLDSALTGSYAWRGTAGRGPVEPENDASASLMRPINMSSVRLRMMHRDRERSAGKPAKSELNRTNHTPMTSNSHPD
jgi:hypothetical protein